MDFEFSARSAQLQQELLAFMDGHVYPAASGDPHSQPPVMEELKAEARGRGLWNLFLPDATWGGGLNNTDYAPLAEIMGRSAIASEAVNCSAPDTGHMELLVLFGTGGQQRRSSWPPRRPGSGPSWRPATGPPEFGGAGLSPAHEEAFGREEAQVAVPRKNELFSVTLELVAPTIVAFGTPAQQRELIPRLLAANLFVCQLFSEPGAGSDLASLSLRAERRGGGWVLNGQKVWTSGARHAALGELIARTDPAQARHRGLTAFLVPMDAPGVEIRPIRQMSGGSSFNEVFFTDVAVPDEARLGEIGQGWQVALTTLGFERAASDAGAQQPGGSFAQAVATARQLGRLGDPLIRQLLADLYVRSEVQRRYAEKMTQSAAAGTPGEDGSVLKLMWSANLMRVSAVVTELLGPRLAADTGEPGLFGWSEHLLGAPGYRIAGGTEEIQRNIIAERVLGLPRDPRPPT
jgi:alkylation response protein AidB-like acyl-CoA dehydrogenase